MTREFAVPIQVPGVTLPSLATMAVYNTTDMTTNYERTRLYYSGNTFNIESGSLGTGVARNIKVIASSSTLEVGANAGPNSDTAVVVRRDTTSMNNLLQVYSTGLTNTAAVQSGILVNPVIAQTGTGGYAAIKANVTESTLGSGVKRLIDLQVANTTKFSVDNAGNTNAIGSITQNGTAVSLAGHTHTKSNITDFAHTHVATDITGTFTSITANGGDFSGSSTQVVLPDIAPSLPTHAATKTYVDTAVAGGSSSIAAIPTVTVFTASGSWTKPANLLYAVVEMVGGGGGGGGVVVAAASEATAAGGGAGGSYTTKTFMGAALTGSSYTVTVGQGAAGGTTAGTNGGNGTDSSGFGLVAGGGGGGGGMNASATNTGVAGGTATSGSGGDYTAIGSDGQPGRVMPNSGGAANINVGLGGASARGFGGSVRVASATQGTSGVAGKLYGGGGSGAYARAAGGFSGGAGADGIVIVTAYIKTTV